MDSKFTLPNPIPQTSPQPVEKPSHIIYSHSEEPQQPSGGSGFMGGLAKFLKILLVLAMFAYLGFLFYRDWQKIPDAKFDLNPVTLCISALVLGLGLLFEVQVWQKNLNLVGGYLSSRQSFKLYYQANPARYIPGKIWSVLGFVHFGEKVHLSPQQTLAGLVTGLVCSTVSAIVLGGILVLASGMVEFKISNLPLVLILALGLFFLHPGVPNLIARICARITRRPFERFSYSAGDIFGVFFYYSLAWIIFSVSFLLLAQSFTDLTYLQMIYTLGVFPLAYAAGYLALFAPGGWGVREGGIALLLSQFMPTYMAVSIAIASRLMFTLYEAIFFGIALKLKWE